MAFLYGWKCLLVMDPGITAALAAGLADYVAYLTPWAPGGRKAVAIAAILLLAAVTALGTRLAANALVLHHRLEARGPRRDRRSWASLARTGRGQPVRSPSFAR